MKGSLAALGFWIGFIAWGCGRSDLSHIRNLDSQGEKIVCFGDSLTQGIGAAAGEDYPSILARQLPYPVINAGRRGDTSTDGLRRLEPDVLRRNPRLVIVLFGGNDFLRQLPLHETRKNLEEMARRIQAQGAMVAVAGLKLGLFTDEYGPIYKEIAKKYRALLIPEVLKGILSDAKLRSDSFHPNGAGYRIMAERILKQVQALLREADRKKSYSPFSDGRSGT